MRCRAHEFLFKMEKYFDDNREKYLAEHHYEWVVITKPEESGVQFFKTKRDLDEYLGFGLHIDFVVEHILTDAEIAARERRQAAATKRYAEESREMHERAKHCKAIVGSRAA